MSRPLGIGQGLAIVRDAATIGARTGADRFDATPGSVDVTAAWLESSDLDGWDYGGEKATECARKTYRAIFHSFSRARCTSGRVTGAVAAGTSLREHDKLDAHVRRRNQRHIRSGQ